MTTHDTHSERMNPSKTWLHLVLLVLLAGILLFVGLGAMGLTDRDEGRNAEAGREMFESGDWISPTFNGEPRYAKPVLVYWLMSLSYGLFGVDEFAARLPSALFGVGLILLQYFFLTKLRGPVVGLFGALMLLLNIEIIGLSRMALTDSVLVFFTTLSLFGFWLGFQGEARDRGWRWLLYVGMAFATLTKGPVGFLVPLITIALFLGLTKQWTRFWQQGAPLAGTILFAALALPWYAMMWHLHGSDYAASAQANTVGRFLNPMEGHSFTILFYVPVLLLGFFPWSGWLPYAWYDAYTSWRASRTGSASEPQHSVLSTQSSRLEWFAAAWVFSVMVFFTLSSTRLAHYIGPLFPAAAILTACYWHRCLLNPQTRGMRAAIHTVMGLGYLLSIGFAALPSIYPSIAGKLTKEFPLALQVGVGIGPYAAAMALLVGMALVGYFGLHDNRRAGAFWAAGASLAVIALIAIQLTFPLLNKFFIAPPQELAYAAGVNLAPNDHFVVYGSTRPSAVFYAKRRATFVPAGEEDTIRRLLAEPGRTMILLPDTFYAKLPKEAEKMVPILKRYGYMLLSNQPMVSIPEEALPPPSTRIPGH